LNVALGGTIRNLRAEEAVADRHGIGTGSFTAHDVTVTAGTRLAEAIGSGDRHVNSFHGQAVGRVGEGLRVCAVADDGVVEGVERPDKTFVVAVQWHPEIRSLTDEEGLVLFQRLVREAKAYRASRVATTGAAPSAGE
jgi:putative glutamine amidotransferase